jgi:Fe2+ transport system protein FeoA
MQTQMTQINQAIANSTLVSSSASMWEIDQGCTAKVIGFVGISTAYLKRMREIGLDIGAEIICLNRPPFSAPRQFQVCDGVFSLDKDIAASIQVSAV